MIFMYSTHSKLTLANKCESHIFAKDILKSRLHSSFIQQIERRADFGVYVAAFDSIFTPVLQEILKN